MNWPKEEKRGMTSPLKRLRFSLAFAVTCEVEIGDSSDQLNILNVRREFDCFVFQPLEISPRYSRRGVMQFASYSIPIRCSSTWSNCDEANTNLKWIQFAVFKPCDFGFCRYGQALPGKDRAQ